MAISETVLEYVQALKWPVLIGGVVFWQRHTIKQAFQHFRMPDEGSVKLTGLGDVSWKNTIHDVNEKTDNVMDEQLKKDIETEEAQPDEHLTAYHEAVAAYRRRRVFWSQWLPIERSVFRDPTLAVINAWETLEREWNEEQATEKEDGDPRQWALEFLNVMDQLRQLRNSVAHGETKISAEAAFEYIQIARRVANEITDRP